MNMTSGDVGQIDVSLLSHTNVGKTTLARTLLRRDIGEVGDRPHVTEFAESHVLIESPGGDSLVLWDTPGFGDSARVLRRLQGDAQPVGWFLSKVWDRLTDRPFWCSQQAMRNAREHSHVVLYVVNAGELPGSSGYIDAEMRILGWIGKPVIVVLNQLGPGRDSAQTQSDVSQWKQLTARYAWVEGVLPFDAFGRCWVQEGTLLTQIRTALPQALQPVAERIQAAWRARNLEVFRCSMAILARQIGRTAADRASIADQDLSGKARAFLGAMTSGGDPSDPALRGAQHALASRLDSAVHASTQELVALHGLSGRATGDVLQWLGGEFAVDRPADADKVSVWGGLVSGALGGLAADLGAGGLTVGAGAIIGGLLGVFGARGLAKAYNLARGSETGTVRWSAEFMTGRVAAALARYLAIAHFGRGRGDFVTGAAPAHWQEAIAGALARRNREFGGVWAASEGPVRADSVAEALRPLITASARDVLVHLYPDVSAVFD